MAANSTKRNAVKPVGESIELSVVKELANSSGGVTYIYDYLVPSGVVVASFEAIKTVDDASANQRARLQVYKVSPGTDAEASETLISEVYAPASTKAGTKLFGTTYANGSSGDPELQVKPQSTASATGLTQQRIRLKVSIAALQAPEAISLSYLLKVQLAKFVNSAYQNADSNEITTN